jgi:hypothetical protein
VGGRGAGAGAGKGGRGADRRKYVVAAVGAWLHAGPTTPQASPRGVIDRESAHTHLGKVPLPQAELAVVQPGLQRVAGQPLGRRPLARRDTALQRGRSPSHVCTRAARTHGETHRTRAHVEGAPVRRGTGQRHVAQGARRHSGGRRRHPSSGARQRDNSTRAQGAQPRLATRHGAHAAWEASNWEWGQRAGCGLWARCGEWVEQMDEGQGRVLVEREGGGGGD